jgi:hypothetical protein
MLAEVVTFLTNAWEMHVLNTGWNIVYPEVLHGSSQSLSANARRMPCNTT